jgi:hypothetical protein
LRIIPFPMPSMKTLLGLCLTLPLLATFARADADWNPERFGGEQTLELLTVGPDEGEHWSTVWLVVIDGQVYVRLGTRSADRFRSSTRAPLVDVRIAGETFHNVRVDPAPEMAERVAAEMANKYWFDIVARQLDHPLTARLLPPEPAHI